MSSNQPAETELLKQVLQPLLMDFQYWFAHSLELLESERLPFMSEQVQADLVTEIKVAQQEVNTTKLLFEATDCKVGIDSQTLLPWHNLVARCWDVARNWRQLNS
ncbi:MAG: DUF2605 domain-containing protein [Cyanobacteria bacterium J06642_3]